LKVTQIYVFLPKNVAQTIVVPNRVGTEIFLLERLKRVMVAKISKIN